MVGTVSMVSVARRVLAAVARPLPAIAISGAGPDSGVGYLQMAKLMGAAKVLAKPFSTNLLIAAIDELLPGDGAPAQPPAAP